MKQRKNRTEGRKSGKEHKVNSKEEGNRSPRYTTELIKYGLDKVFRTIHCMFQRALDTEEL